AQTWFTKTKSWKDSLTGSQRGSSLMKKTAATLSLLALGACASMQESEGPSSAFRLTSPGMPDNSRLPAKAAGYSAKNPNCTGQNVSPAPLWSQTHDTESHHDI